MAESSEAGYLPGVHGQLFSGCCLRTVGHGNCLALFQAAEMAKLKEQA